MVFPYISFSGKCRDALSFYEKVFKSEKAHIMHYSDAPEGALPEGIDKNYVMHASMNILGTKFYFCDMADPVNYGGGITLHIETGTPEEALAIFTLLKEGGIVTMELAEQFYAKAYGCICDRFGINWAIMCE